MKVSAVTRHVLKVRRELRDMPRHGWELVSESGGRLWELHRGYRLRHVITDVRIAATGKDLWIKTAEVTADA